MNGSPDLFSASYLLQVAGSLLLVFGALFGLAFFLKKFNGVPVGDRRALRILSSVKVGTREKLLVVDTGDAQLLIGVAAGSVRTLHVFEGTAVNHDNAEDVDLEFASVLDGATHREAKV